MNGVLAPTSFYKPPVLWWETRSWTTNGSDRMKEVRPSSEETGCSIADKNGAQSRQTTTPMKRRSRMLPQLTLSSPFERL
ncbi:hypothetical protein CMUS01_03140 [Colletotrichum musicola]|uniref:Uncharacterized protein n=1 Tax=Colletotrichum musicola TaxID=2175873 RepID=A0A8H6U6X4_9PEZI|nr:hypothetical protein CMUS01_03140 [Colletotrichum musicola]